MRRRLLGSAGGVAVLLAAGLPVLPAAAEGEGAHKRAWPTARPTPTLELRGLDGRPWRLAEARGQVVLLNFWASWCEPCRSEMPSLELLAQRHEAQGLRVIAVNLRETDAAIRRFLAQMPIDLPILRDADGLAARAFDVRIYPTTVAIGRDGKAAFWVIGETDWTGAAAREWLAPLLKT